MYSYREFTPGRKSRCGKLIQYVEHSKPCTYINSEIINKSFLKNNTSNAQRISQIINNSKGGSTQFGNYYLGEPVVFNYLGRVEGQPGGSGAPIRNRF